ncbi:MAG TPA: polysaccharide deacetylase family protein [Pyrinomonadaceae bacterium]
MPELKRRCAVLAFVLAASVCAFAQGAATQQTQTQTKREVAVTFDDLPAPYGDLENLRYVTSRLVESFKRNKVPVVGFVNENKLYKAGEVDERIALLRAWADAGFELGNHTYSHINMNRAPLEDYRDDIIRGETVTAMLMREKGLKLRYFRHPFLFTGITPEYKRGLDEFLAARGYTVAPVSVDNADYVFASVYHKAKQRGDKETARRVADAYVPYMEVMFDYFERQSKAVVGREVKQVLLVHANELNADRFDELVAMIKQRGYTFVTLEEALTDPAYKLPEAQVTGGMSWLHRWRMARGEKATEREPSEPEWVTELFRAGQQGN